MGIRSWCYRTSCHSIRSGHLPNLIESKGVGSGRTRPSHKPGMVQTRRKVGGSGYPAGIEVTADFRPGGRKTRKECQ